MDNFTVTYINIKLTEQFYQKVTQQERVINGRTDGCTKQII